jgi:hypothetical protein
MLPKKYHKDACLKCIGVIAYDLNTHKASNKIVHDTVNSVVSINELDDKKDIHDLLEYIRKVKEE